MDTSARLVVEVRCLHCARRVGTWEWSADAPQRNGVFKPAGEQDARRGQVPRCPACGGPLFLDQAEVFQAIDYTGLRRTKRGRKRKQQAA